MKKYRIPGMNPFDFQIKYSQTDRKSHRFEIEMHTHLEFEIYINLSGDVSFLVNNRLYPLTRGDIIVARPGEWHHCVYRSDAPHRLFWILFECQANPNFFEFFTSSDVNYISASEDVKNELIELGFLMLKENQSDFEKTSSFFRLLKIIKEYSSKTENPGPIPDDFARILNYIDCHITENIRVCDISKGTFISTSTIERRFREYINLTPMQFIQKKKMSLAAQLLRKGESVLNTGENVGYSDNSYFIQVFKRYFQMTPYEYKKKRDRV